MAKADGGNDRSQALAELADQFGTGDARAENLIAESRARYRGDLGKAQLKQVDDEATAALDKGAVAKAAGCKQADLASATVRGDYVVYLIDDGEGRPEKGAIPLSDVGKSSGGSKAKTDDTKAKSRSGD